MLRENARAGDTVTENSYRAIPAAHYLGRFQTVMHNILRDRIIEGAAQLPPDIEQIPNRESFFARQHSGNAVALHIFHGGAELAFEYSRAEDRCYVGAAHCLGALSLGQQRLFERSGAVAERAQ